MELIDKCALLKSSGYNVRDCSIGVEYIISAPTVDAAPVVHGRWLDTSGLLFEPDKCSVCGTFASNTKNMKYCPSCGAKMDLPEKESTQ